MHSIKRLGGGGGNISAKDAVEYYERELRRMLADRMERARLDAKQEPSTAAKVEGYQLGDPGAPLATWWSARDQLAPNGAPIVPGQLKEMLEGRGVFGRFAGQTLVQQAARAERVVGWDSTFSAPKSVSVLYAASDDKLRDEIMRDMRASAAAALQAMYDRGVYETRTGKGSKVRENAHDIAVALYPQATSRAGDPQLHVHGVTVNIGLRADGSTGALDPKGLYPWKTYGGAVFRAELAARLAQRGIAIEEDGQAFRISGVPEELVAVWSKRRRVILDAIDKLRDKLERGALHEMEAATSPAARQGPLRDRDVESADIRGERLRKLKDEISQATREGKDDVAHGPELEKRWLEEMEAIGLSREAVWHAVREAAANVQPSPKAAAEAALEEAFTRSAVVTERTLRRLVAEHAQTRGIGAEGAHAEFDRLLRTGQLLGLRENSKGERVYSTREALERERQMLISARSRIGERERNRGVGGYIKAREIEREIARLEAIAAAEPDPEKQRRLSPQQLAAVRHAAKGDGVVCIEGAAGSGKSFALGAIKTAAEASGCVVIGLAPSWKAAHVVRKDTQLPGTRALQGFVKDLNAGRVQFGSAPKRGAPRGVTYLGDKVVILLDEAGMAGSQDLADLERHAANARATLITSGDRRQLKAVDPGAPFASLVDTLGVARMDEVRRQALDWQREASQVFANGDSVEGLARYDARERIAWCDSEADAKARIVAAVEANERLHPDKTRAVLAHGNRDVHELNAIQRARILEQGKLGPDALTVETLHSGGRGGDGEVREMEIRTGERVVVGVNLTRYGRDVSNGDVATVEGIRFGKDPVLSLRLDRKGADEKPIRVSLRLSELMPGSEDAPRVPVLQHAYALTIHKSQGATIDFPFVYAGRGMAADIAYVGLTRQKEDVAVFVDAGGIREMLAEEGVRPTEEAVKAAFYRAAKAPADSDNAGDYVADKQEWLRTGDPMATRPAETMTDRTVNAVARETAALAEASPPPMMAPREAARRAEQHEAVRASMTAVETRVASQSATPSAEVEPSIAREYSRERAAVERPAQIEAAIEVGRRAARAAAEARPAATRREKERTRATTEAISRRAPNIRSRRARLQFRLERITQHAEARLRSVRVDLPSALTQLRDGLRKAFPDRATWTAERAKDVAWCARHGIAPVTAQQGRGEKAQSAVVAPEPVFDRRLVRVEDLVQRLAAEKARVDARALALWTAQGGKAARWPEFRRSLAAAGDAAGEIGQLAARSLGITQCQADLSAARLRPDQRIRAVDPSAPDALAAEIRLIRPVPDVDLSAFDGRRTTVRGVIGMLSAARRSVPETLSEPSRQIDGALGSLQEAVREGRVSPDTPMAAALPTDHWSWRAAVRSAFRAAAEAVTRVVSPSRAYAEQRQAAEVLQSVRARDAHAPTVQQEIAALRAEEARAAQDQQQVRQRPTFGG